MYEKAVIAARKHVKNAVCREWHPVHSPGGKANGPERSYSGENGHLGNLTDTGAAIRINLSNLRRFR